MTHFELITVRVFDDAGAEGMGYTYTVGCNGAAIHSQIQRDLAPLLIGQSADRIESLVAADVVAAALRRARRQRRASPFRRWISRCGI